MGRDHWRSRHQEPDFLLWWLSGGQAEVEWFRIFTSGNIGVPVLQAMKRRLLREHHELLHLYLIQPATVSLWGLCLAMGYRMPAPATAEGGA